MTRAAAAATLRDDARTIGIVGVAHATSHFFHMLLPPLFPVFIAEFGLSYSELGLLVTLFFVVSGIGQALAGFLVDRVGARPVLYAALGCFVASALALAGAGGVAGLALASALAGLGNAPFHPIDFTILNRRIAAPRIGHAYSVHGISGSLGWAAAPLFMTGVTAATGSWRAAAALAALAALTVLALAWLQRDALDDRHAAAPAVAPAPGAAAGSSFDFLKLPSVWLCFSFFFWSTCALAAVQGFAGPALQSIYGLPLTTASTVVSGYMLCSAAGILVGGFAVQRARSLERLIGVCLFAAAAMLVAAGSGLLPAAAALLLASLAGFGTGLAGPSRDLLIKRASPPGASGRVYGTVYSGLDLGFAVSAPVFGALLDRYAGAAVFHAAALTLLAGIASAWLVGWHGARTAQRADERIAA